MAAAMLSSRGVMQVRCSSERSPPIRDSGVTRYSKAVVASAGTDQGSYLKILVQPCQGCSATEKRTDTALCQLLSTVTGGQQTNPDSLGCDRSSSCDRLWFR